jgi:alkaline phosphatase
MVQMFLFGAGAENFLPGSRSYKGQDYLKLFANKGYTVSLNNTSLATASNSSKALGLFCTSNLPVWLDRNVYKDNLKAFKNDPTGAKAQALDLPGLKEMTLKAIDILHARGGEKGFFMMSEAASIDKQMHTLDYDRALGDLLELDDTIKATTAKLTALGELNNTLIIVTADTKYLSAQKSDRAKRSAIGVYTNSGLSQYTIPNGSVNYNTGVNFPVNWDPRYTLAQGLGTNPDHREKLSCPFGGA